MFLAVSFASMTLAATLLGPLFDAAFRFAGLYGVGTESWVEAAGLLGGTAVVLRGIERRPWRDVWMDRNAAMPRLLAIGCGAGMLAIGLPIVALIGVHWLRASTAGAGSWWVATSRTTIFLLPAALAEELVVRGYILSVLREAWGWPWAITATSLGFGMLHLANNGATAESLALVTTAGFFLAAVLYATRSLYAAWMAHFAWNWTMAALFHTAVSGYPLDAPGYRYVDAGPDWATGGVWGPEGGLPAGLGMALTAALVFWLRAQRSRLPNKHTGEEDG